MALNTDIILQGRPAAIEAPDAMGQYGKALQLKQLMTQGQLQDQQLADDQSAREAFAASGGDRNKYLQALASGGNVKAYQSAQKNYLDTDKAQADITKSQAEADYKRKEIQNMLVKQHRDMLADVRTPADALAWADLGLKMGAFPGGKDQYDAGVRTINDIAQKGDPLLFNNWRNQAALGATDFIEKNKPVYQTRNLGGTTDTIALPGLGGPAQVVSSMRNTVSPDAALSAATQRRGQDLTDARQREANAIQNAGKTSEISTQLRKEFDQLPEVKNYKQALPAYKAIEDAVTRNSTQSDINLVYGIAKLYDPNSVVREGEYATVANSPNIPERIKGYAQYIQGGGRLTPEVKSQILAEAQGRVKTFEDQYSQARQGYSDIAGRSGGDPSLVFPAPQQPAVNAPVGPKTPRKGTIDNGYEFLGGDPADQKNWRKR